MNSATVPGWALQGAGANVAVGGDGLLLRVGASVAPTVLRLEAVEAPGRATQTIVIDVLPGARCTLFESHGEDSAQNLRVNVNLGERSALDHVRVVHSPAAAELAHTVQVRVGEDAHYAQRLVATGAAAHQQRTDIDLAARGAQASVRAVLLGDGTVLEQQVRSRHAAPATISSVETLALGSGAARLGGEAFTAIAPGCDGAAAHQRLTGVPTSGQPRLTLRPHLEIHHDDVQAAHGATWGALPEDALFHARQRGIGERAATALIVEGLARAVLSRDAELPPEAEAALAAAVAGHLATDKEALHG
jgi:Fe-S cluster assembly protein SufD